MDFPSIGELQKMLPAANDNYEKILDKQNVFDIVLETKNCHKLWADQYDMICKKFWKGKVVDTCKALFDFCKEYIPYDRESEKVQTGKSPAQILKDANNKDVAHDCKHYALFCVGVVGALERKGYPIHAYYRFASDLAKEKYPKHVFCVVPTGTGDIWVDPVLDGLNQYHPYYYFLDKQPPKMAYYRVSGVQKEQVQVCGFGAVSPSVAGPGHGGGHHVHHGGRRRGWDGGWTPGETTVVNTFGYDDYDDDDENRVGANVFKKLGKGIKNLGKGIEHDISKAGKGIKHLEKGVQKDVKKAGEALKKINPGQFVMKVGMTPSRNAFLLLMKVNLFDLAYNMMKHAQTPAGEKKLKDLWKKVGGQWKHLARDINQGYARYMRNHHKTMPAGYHTLSGMAYIGQVETAGFAASIAAAMPIIKVFTDLFKSLGIDVTKITNHGAKGTEIVAIHHNASGKGHSDSEFGTGVEVGPDGKQTLHVSSFMGNKLESDEGDSMPVPGEDPRAFLPAGPQGYAPGNEDAQYDAAPSPDVQQDVENKLAEKQADAEIPDAKSAPAKAVNVVTDWMRGFSDFVSHNKGLVITGASILGLIIISRSPLLTGKKRR